MRIGDLVRVCDRLDFIYPEYRGVVGIIVDISDLGRNKRVRWFHSVIRGEEYTVMDERFLEVINENR